MANTKTGAKYSFEGQYYTGSKDTAEQVKNYALDVIFPEVTPKALSLFKTSLNRQNDGIYKLMLTKYPDFKRVRTMYVTNVVDLAGKNAGGNSIATMNTKQLVAYIKKNDLEIDAEIYEGDITRLREAIIMAQEDPEKFKEVYAADVEAYNFNKSINDLNNVPADGTGEGSTENAPSNPPVNNEGNGELDAADLLGLEGKDDTNDEGNDDEK